MKNILISLTLLILPFSASFAKEKAAPTKFKVTDQSVVKWEAHKIGGGHSGEVKVKGGELTLDANGSLSSGNVIVDMPSITSTDVADKEMNKKLVTHLKSDDFFSVDKFPTAKFTFDKAPAAKDGKYTVTGDLTIKGLTHPATAIIEGSKDKSGKVFKGKAEITVDRTKYDIRFRSSKFFENLGDKVIKDEFKLVVDLTAAKE